LFHSKLGETANVISLRITGVKGQKVVFGIPVALLAVVVALVVDVASLAPE
jgi:hypothetical protein